MDSSPNAVLHLRLARLSFALSTEARLKITSARRSERVIVAVYVIHKMCPIHERKMLNAQDANVLLTTAFPQYNGL
jgi:hypothetical protein